MARRLYALRGYDPLAYPANIEALAGAAGRTRLALHYYPDFRAFGAFAEDGTLIANPPPMPARIARLPLAGRWWLLALDATDWSWADGRPGVQVPAPPYTQRLTTAQRTAVRDRLAGTDVEIVVGSTDTIGDVLDRLLALSSRSIGSRPALIDAIGANVSKG